MNGKMKAQVYYEPGVMKLETVDIPALSANEVLIRVKACGICGSDLAYFFGRTPLDTKDGKGPLILGHEFAGEVVEVGQIAAGLGLFKPGDRVLANPVQQCNACEECTKGNVHMCPNTRTKGVGVDGAFAEYAAVNYTHLYKIPASISLEDAALCEPLACATNGVTRLDIALGDTVVIFGPGTIGLMMTQLAKASGAGMVVMAGIIDYGLETALTLGADHVINTAKLNSKYYAADLAKAIAELTDGQMAQKVIVPTSAKPALQGALEVSGKRSVIVYFGLPGSDVKVEVPLLDTLTKDKTIKVSWLAPNSWAPAIKALSTRKIALSSLITHRYTLEELEKGMRVMDDSAMEAKTKAIVVF